MENHNLEKFCDMHIHMSSVDFDLCEHYLNVVSKCATDAVLNCLTYRALCYNLSALYWKKNFKNLNLSVFGMIHNMPGYDGKPDDIYKDIPYEKQAKLLMDLGCDGIKLMFCAHTIKTLGHGIDDSSYDAMFDYLEENGIPVVVHLNDDERYWIPRELTENEIKRHWGLFLEGYPTKQEIYEQGYKRLNKNPNLKLILAHFYFLASDINECEKILNTYPNVCFDLTPGRSMYFRFSENIDKWHDFFEKYQDRIFFGTDSNNIKSDEGNIGLNNLVWSALTHDRTQFNLPNFGGMTIKGLGLSKEAINKICYENYKKYVPQIKPVNYDLLLKCAKKMYEDIKDSDNEFYVTSKNWLLELFERSK